VSLGHPPPPDAVVILPVLAILHLCLSLPKLNHSPTEVGDDDLDNRYGAGAGGAHLQPPREGNRLQTPPDLQVDR
jgi:hypothetical protein